MLNQLKRKSKTSELEAIQTTNNSEPIKTDLRLENIFIGKQIYKHTSAMKNVLNLILIVGTAFVVLSRNSITNGKKDISEK